MRGAGIVFAGWVCLCSTCVMWGQFRLPIPRRGGQGKQTPAERKAPDKKVTRHFSGVVRARSAESVSILNADTRIIEFLCSKETKFSAAVKPGDEVRVEAWSDEDGFFHALSVTLSKPAPPPVSEEPRPVVLTPPPAAPEPDDPGRPALRRGRPAPRETAAVEPEQGIPEPAQPDAFLEKVREVALEFTESLPNYLCKQMTTRYQSESRPSNWQAQDVVGAAVVYEDGRESYRDIRINDKPTKKDMDSIPGSRSRGEFGSTLRDLFSPSTAAAFRFRRESTAAGLRAAVYEFQVEQPNSHWENRVAGQSVFPSYKGSVWIDRRSHRVLRIEMQARNLPQEFPLDASEWVVDYEFVRIGPAPYLVPVHAENLACFRGTSRCVRNATDFRNYRRFTSESQILTVDSTVSFEGAEKKP
ncbi:MAG: hypothetical protein HY822_21565 [Acidobacteria bacterium]|nr:hypothetical protein [Acidobacteriota bacterium]